MIERRKYPRIDSGDYVFVTRLPEERHGSDGGGTNFHRTADVSRNGFRFQTERHIEDGALVKVLLPTEGTTEALTILGIVRWADTHSNEDKKFSIGIEFFDLDNADGQVWIDKYEKQAFQTLEKLQRYFAQV